MAVFRKKAAEPKKKHRLRRALLGTVAATAIATGTLYGGARLAATHAPAPIASRAKAAVTAVDSSVSRRVEAVRGKTSEITQSTKATAKKGYEAGKRKTKDTAKRIGWGALGAATAVGAAHYLSKGKASGRTKSAIMAGAAIGGAAAPGVTMTGVGAYALGKTAWKALSRKRQEQVVVGTAKGIGNAARGATTVVRKLPPKKRG